MEGILEFKMGKSGWGMEQFLKASTRLAVYFTFRHANLKPFTLHCQINLATGYWRNTFLPDLVNPLTMYNLHWTGHYIHDPTLAHTTALHNSRDTPSAPAPSSAGPMPPPPSDSR
ncbi:hypothetical protein B0H17DRAFT_1327734, partial [Mycena rosella]